MVCLCGASTGSSLAHTGHRLFPKGFQESLQQLSCVILTSPCAADQKLEEMEAADAKIQKEISGLQNERAVILAQLEKIELALTKAQAAKVC